MSNSKRLTKLSTALSNKPKLTKMDRFRAYYLEGKHLPQNLHESMLKLEQANGLLCSGYSREQAVKFIMTSKNISRTEAYRVVREAMELFGDVTESSKKGLQHILTENLMQCYNMARQAKDITAAMEALDKVARVNGLYKHDGPVVDLNYLHLQNIKVEFTTNPQALSLNATQPITEWDDASISE